MLEDSKLLADYTIKQDSTVFLSTKPPPKDILNFDACSFCECQAIEPCVLPCGHSCCKNTCLSADATICPVDGCKASLGDSSRETLPLNWVSSHFFDAKETQPTKNCQICSEDGIQKEATHWCESCSKVSSFEYYCGECVVTEHSSRKDRDHIRIPIENMSARTSFPECSKHKLPQDLFCFDEGMPICYRCRDEEHKPPHKVKLIVECEKEVKGDLQASVRPLMDLKQFEDDETALKQAKQLRIEEITRLQEENVLIEGILKEIQEHKTKRKSASASLTKTIEEYPIQGLLYQKKLSIMKSRVDQTLQILEDEKPKKYTKVSYVFLHCGVRYETNSC